MKKILALQLFVATTFWTGAVLANGGGYVTGGAENTGDITGFEPKSTESIRMVEESLNIKLGPKSAKVEIRYRMENVANRRVSVRFGFPVEESPEVRGLGIGAALPPASEIKVHDSPLYCKGYTILDGGKPVKAKWQGENRASKDERFAHLGGWFVSEVSFGPREVKDWSIAFESVYPSNFYSRSEDGFTSALLFKYRLSSAACWAGTIGKGRIVLEPDGIDPDDVRIIRPVNRFRKVGPSWVWEFTEFEPTLDDDLEIEAQPPVATFSEGTSAGPVTYANRGERWEVAHANYAITASSTLPPEGERQYAPEKLKEFGQAWVEGAAGSGVDEWLEIMPEIAKPLAAIVFSPGFPDRGGSLFKANARPKRIRVNLNDEHALSVDIPPDPASVRIPISDYSKPVSKIRLTFEKVWPGDQFEDLCLHTLRLHVALDKKPDVQPSR